MSLVTELITELKLETSKFRSELASVKNEVGSTHKAISTSTLAITAAVSAAVGAIALIGNEITKSTLKIDEMAKSSAKLGISTDSFQSLAYAANLTGTSMDAVSTAFSIMSKNIYAAQQGNEKAIKSFKDLGLNADNLKGLSIDQQFTSIANSISKVSDSTSQLALARQIFGKGALENMALLKADIGGIQAEYNKLGISLSTEQVKQTEKAEESRKKLNAIFSGFAQNVTADIAPAFTFLTQSLTGVITETGGMKTAAASTASFMISSVSEMIKAYNTLSDVISTVGKGANDWVQEWVRGIKEGANILSRSTGLGQNSTGFSIDGWINEWARGIHEGINTASRLTGLGHQTPYTSLDGSVTSTEGGRFSIPSAPQVLGNGESNITRGLDKIAAGLGVNNNATKATNAATKATESFTDSVNGAAKSLKSLFGIDTKSDASSYISDATKGKITPEQFHYKGFDDELLAIKKDIANGVKITSGDIDSLEERLSYAKLLISDKDSVGGVYKDQNGKTINTSGLIGGLNDNILDNATLHPYTTSGMEAVVKQLQEIVPSTSTSSGSNPNIFQNGNAFADKLDKVLAKNNKPVDIALHYDQNGIINAVITSGQTTSYIQSIAKDLVRNEAATSS